MDNEIDINKEREFTPSKIAIAMTTSYLGWYPGELRSIEDTDKVRGDLGLEMIRTAVGKGYNVVIADQESPKAFKDEVLGLAVRVIEREPGGTRASGRKSAIEASSVIPGVKAIIRTEPEKVSLLDFVPEICGPILKGEADIVVPKRRDEEFRASCPSYMYESEIAANKKYNSILHEFDLLPEGQDLDMYFAPTVLANDPMVLDLFKERYAFKPDKIVKTGIRRYVRPDDFSNSQFFGVVKALHLRLRVVSVEIPFIYPSSQKANEVVRYESFAEKRKIQKWSILDELVLFIRYLRDPNSSKNVLEKIE